MLCWKTEFYCPEQFLSGGAPTGSRFWRENWMYTIEEVTRLIVPAWPQVSGRTAEPAPGCPFQTLELVWEGSSAIVLFFRRNQKSGHDSEYISIQDGSLKTRPVLVKPGQLSTSPWEPYCPRPSHFLWTIIRDTSSTKARSNFYLKQPQTTLTLKWQRCPHLLLETQK